MKHLYDIKTGARFMYGGVEWVKLATGGGAVVALAANNLFQKAFDEENCNDWRNSSLRKHANGAFLDKMVDDGADYDAFVEFDSDLTADDGMKNYGCATDKIALLTCDQYRAYRDIIPMIDEWWWTLTPWTCDPEYSYYVRNVSSSGALYDYDAYDGDGGVRPLCNLKSDILVSVPGEEGKDEIGQAAHVEATMNACDAVLEALNDYPSEIWGDALGAAVASLLTSKRDAQAIAEDEQERKAQE